MRAKIATMLLDETKTGNITSLIVRAADFYGPGALLSMTHTIVNERLKAGKAAQWLGHPKKLHTFTYTSDAGKATALLGNSQAAYNQTWHALSSAEKITGEEYVRMASEVLDKPGKKIQALPKWGVRMLGLFVPVLTEFVEMMYQFENDYLFDSSKAQTFLNENATSYKEGITKTLK